MLPNKRVESDSLRRRSAPPSLAAHAQRKPANVRFRPKTVIRGVDLRSIEDTAAIELLLTRPERNVER